MGVLLDRAKCLLLVLLRKTEREIVEALAGTGGVLPSSASRIQWNRSAKQRYISK